MTRFVPDADFIHGVLVGLAFAVAASAAGLVYSIIAGTLATDVKRSA